MEQNRNMEQGGTATTVPAEKKNENRKREISGVGKSPLPTERLAIADGVISADDRLALNRYLNSGKDNERMTADNAQEHRLNRAFQLLERVAEFCDKRQLVTVNRSLLSIAVDAADISRAVSSLDKRPAPGQPFPNNTGTSGAGK